MKLTKIKASYLTGIDDDGDIHIIYELEDGRLANKTEFNRNDKKLKEVQDEIDRINNKHKSKL